MVGGGVSDSVRTWELALHFFRNTLVNVSLFVNSQRAMALYISFWKMS